jgi:hypothetical protein
VDRLRIFLWVFGLYLGLAGTITFSMFIHEEAIQTATWGTWPAADVKDWKTVRVGIATISSINKSMKIINYACGWIQPLAFISYRKYGQSTDYYIKGLTAKVFANAPELYIGELVEFNFRPQQSEKLANGDCAYRFGKVIVIAECEIRIGEFMSVKGVVTQEGKQLKVVNR